MAGVSPEAVPYGASPIFDENSLPEKLRNEHSTKDGTWGLLRVLEGEVELIFIDPPSQRLVSVDNPAPIPPQAPHFVRVTGPMKMQVEFYREHPLPDESRSERSVSRRPARRPA